MACNGCTTGRGNNSLPAGCNNNGTCGTGGCNKLNVFDWLADISSPAAAKNNKYVEVRFKNSRKEFYNNVNNIPLSLGDVVAVEGSPGHDIGTVSITGELVNLQMKRKKNSLKGNEPKKLYRKARQNDVEKWHQCIEKEDEVKNEARRIAVDLGLQMKIGDVEFQGDGTKATFYYTADDRVDFRELIKIFAEKFKVRIEMRQIGARQEASRLGGIGSCGRELCCSTWLTDFRSVTTSAARYQQLSLNPQKLAGQCGKLKCCLNFELDSYLDAIRNFPSTDIKLKLKNGIAFHQKTDIFKNVMWYSVQFKGENSGPFSFVPLTTETVHDIIKMNKKGVFPENLNDLKIEEEDTTPVNDYENVVGQDDLTRFDKLNKKRKNNRNKKRAKGGNNNPSNNRNKEQGNKNNNKKKQNQKNAGPQNKKKGNPNFKKKNNFKKNKENNKKSE